MAVFRTVALVAEPDGFISFPKFAECMAQIIKGAGNGRSLSDPRVQVGTSVRVLSDHFIYH